MPISLPNFNEQATQAVKLFWRTRLAASSKQSVNGVSDRGERSAVTAGKNMDGFLNLMIDVVKNNGLQEANIYLDRNVLTLPGYFRPTKLWDMLVMNQGRLVAAIEFKSQVGPSFGNNFNNRTEEALGTALDLKTAFREGALGDQPAPFMGWLILLEDAPQSQRPVRDKSPHFPVFPEFEGASYAKRYDILCRKMMLKQLYTSASIILSSRSSIETGDYSDISNMTGLKNFVVSLAGHVAAEAAR
jgi:type II restriction enzyme